MGFTSPLKNTKKHQQQNLLHRPYENKINSNFLAHSHSHELSPKQDPPPLPPINPEQKQQQNTTTQTKEIHHQCLCSQKCVFSNSTNLIGIIKGSRVGHSAEVDRSVAKKRHDLLHNLPGILNVPVIAPNVAHLSNPGVVRLQRTGG